MPEMPTFHDIRIWVEKGVDALEQMTKQISRAAWARESERLSISPLRRTPCPSCRSSLVPETAGECPACGVALETPKEYMDA